jgi:hypothetical protein
MNFNWVLAGLGVVVVYIYLKGRKGSTSYGTSVANATNTPTFTVTSMGHSVTQNIPANQVSPQEPGTAPLFNSGQYG